MAQTAKTLAARKAAKGETRREALPGEKLDLRAELDKLEGSVSELKVLYEQYFAGLMPLAPERQHNEIKRHIRKLLQAPFKNSAASFRLKSLEGRYQALNTYWQRVLKQREDGTYSKDVFKSELREKTANEEQRAQTAQGQAEKSLRHLFDSYCSALEHNTGQAQKLDFDLFQRSLVKRAKDLKEKHPEKKLTFKVVVKNGKVTIQAKTKGT